MTTQEFQDWKQVTESSRFNWVVDQAQLRNSNRYLIYKGGQSGQFISIEPDGTASIGNYDGAIPHIGEACFQVKHTRKCANQDEALARLIEVAGLKFLLDIVGIPCYR